MSHIRTCDYCGQVIDQGDPYVTLHQFPSALTIRQRAHPWSTGDIGHYHATDECYGRIDNALTLTHEWGNTIEAIPTTNGQTVAALRRNHRPPTGAATDQTPVHHLVPATPDELAMLRARLTPKCRHVLPRAGIRTIEQLQALTDDELLSLYGLGPGMLHIIREWLADLADERTAPQDKQR